MLSGGGLASAIIREHLIRMVTAGGKLLPLAVAIAISITTIITTVLMLLSPKAKRRTVGLLVGCVVGVGGAVALFAFLGGLLPTQDSGGSSLVTGVINMVVGVLLVVLALRQWRGRAARGDRAELPKWMAEVELHDAEQGARARPAVVRGGSEEPVACSFGRSHRRRGHAQRRRGAQSSSSSSPRSPHRPWRYRLSPTSRRRRECAARSRDCGSGWWRTM